MAHYLNNEEINNSPGNYYVSVVDGSRSSLLLGPFSKHMEALLKVEAVRKLANELEPKSHFYGFGTAKSDSNRAGLLNDMF